MIASSQTFSLLNIVATFNCKAYDGDAERLAREARRADAIDMLCSRDELNMLRIHCEPSIIFAKNN